MQGLAGGSCGDARRGACKGQPLPLAWLLQHADGHTTGWRITLSCPDPRAAGANTDCVSCAGMELGGRRLGGSQGASKIWFCELGRLNLILSSYDPWQK